MSGNEIFGMRIAAIAAYAPRLIVTNKMITARLRLERLRTNSYLRNAGKPQLDKDAEKLFKTGDRWIQRFIGFYERRYAIEGEGTIDLATHAAQTLFNAVDSSCLEVDCIVFGTVTPSYRSSNPDSNELQDRLGIPSMDGDVPREIYCVDSALACSTWPAALQIAYSRIRSGMSKCVLLIGADKMSVTINWRDRAFACVLGDAGTATLCVAVPPEEDWFDLNQFWSWSGGEYAHVIRSPMGGSKNPITTAEQLVQYQDRLAMDGRLVKDFFIPFMSGPVIEAVMGKSGWSLPMIDLVTLHEANRSELNDPIVKNWQKKGFTGQVLDAGGMFGNTASASIPLGLALNAKSLEVGKRFLLGGFGGSFTVNIACGEIKHPITVAVNV